MLCVCSPFARLEVASRLPLVATVNVSLIMLLSNRLILAPASKKTHHRKRVERTLPYLTFFERQRVPRVE